MMPSLSPEPEMVNDEAFIYDVNDFIMASAAGSMSARSAESPFIFFFLSRSSTFIMSYSGKKSSMSMLKLCTVSKGYLCTILLILNTLRKLPPTPIICTSGSS